MTATLSPDAFRDFYQRIHGYPPFPWQQDLAARVLTECRWPSLVDVPTGLGKTSMLDIAVFVAAATAHETGTARVGRRRCLFVVDRRIVVDEAHAHGEKIAAALSTTPDDGGVVARVAAGLRALGGDGTGAPLTVTKMRGGTTWASSWLDRPDLPGLVIGTVDQVGSRLLFRGYGVSDRRRPIDAALVGTDALLLVDEAHLATALLTTAAAAGQRDQSGLPLPGVEIVRLTATPHGDESEPDRRPYELDLDAHLRHLVAAQRLNATKTLALVATGDAKSCRATMARLAVRAAEAGSGGRGVLVVCNTIDTARAVHTLVQKAVTTRDGSTSADVELLIGRARPVDRAMLNERILDRFGVGAEPVARPAVLVATQTVEVGINLDVDVLITESASWDALVQRLGRLNRLGHHPEGRAVVVHDGQADGPVYGAARDATWQQLCRDTPPADESAALTDAGIGVSPLQCRTLSAAMPAAAYPRRTDVPILTTPILDHWVRTAPVPTIDPPVDPYLHGFDAGSPGVVLAWRDGLIRDVDRTTLDETGVEMAAETANALLAAVPLRATECVEVPLHAVRRWMSGQKPTPVSDIDVAPDIDGPQQEERPPFEVLAWREDPTRGGAWRWTDAAGLRPGDQLVVPTERGGHDRYGWNPRSTSPVPDAAEAAALQAGRPMLRLDAGLGRRLGLSAEDTARIGALVQATVDDYRRQGEPDDAIDVHDPPGPTDPLAELLAALRAVTPAEENTTLLAQRWNQVQAWLDRLAAAPAQARLVQTLRRPERMLVTGTTTVDALQVLLTGPALRGPGTPLADDPIGRTDDDVLATSIAPAPVTLHQHLTGVRRRAEHIADRLGLPPDLRQTVSDAAGWHDLGKVEERFQVMLHRGDAFEAAVAPEPLAKSGLDPHDKAAWRIAAHRSGLPHGARHEAWSAALVAEYLQQVSTYDGDADLLLHLVASHHGHARPLLPLVVDDAPRPIEAQINDVKLRVRSDDLIDLDHPARFALLNQRYGRWGLALLEAVVRCADMTVSAEGS